MSFLLMSMISLVEKTDPKLRNEYLFIAIMQMPNEEVLHPVFTQLKSQFELYWWSLSFVTNRIMKIDSLMRFNKR